MNRAARWQRKAEALRDFAASLNYPVTYSLNGYRVAVLEAPTVQLANGNYKLSFNVAARVVGGAVLPVDDVYEFVNPPFKVPNGTFRQEVQLDGSMADVANFEEKPLQAIQSFLLDAVLIYARSKGAQV